MSTHDEAKLKGMEHPRLVVNPFLIYLGMMAFSAVLQLLLPLPFLSPGSARLVGVALFLVNLVFGLPALRKMFAAKTSPNPNQPASSLIRTGPYRFSRNPMYIGLTLLYAGLVTFLRLPWGLVLLPVVVWLITIWVIQSEEHYLEQKFGNEYLEYKHKVRRWI